MLDSQLEQLRQENTALKQQLEKSQKMTCLGELVGTTTHEFNNVLMTIINYARMGLRHTDEPTRTKAFEKILNASSRANQITNSVLGMARNRSDRFETTCLRTVIEQTMVLMERELQKYRVCVELNLGDVPPVWAVGNQIQQVFLNLLINARQAMPDGGRIVVNTIHDADSNAVDLVVRDFGCGIAQDKLKRIFESGFTSKDGPDESGKGGTGLGLYTCRSIIESHQGKIRVESTVGQGTAFTIKLPVTKKAEPTIPLASASSAVPTPISPSTH